MESKQSKFNLLDSMMSRLGVTPGVLTTEWLKSKAIPFVFVPQESVVKMGITGKIVSSKLHKSSKEETAPATETSTQEPAKSTKGKTKGVGKKPASEDSLFYNEKWDEIDDEFKLNKETVSQLRCGMFAYLHGSKVVITKKKLSSQKERNQNYIRLGVVFDLSENLLLILSLCALKSNYSKVTERLLADCRLPTGDECVKLFVYKELLHKGFSRLNINFKDAKKIFYEDIDHEVGKIGVFDFQEGKSTERSQETAQADAYQVQTIKLN